MFSRLFGSRAGAVERVEPAIMAVQEPARPVALQSSAGVDQWKEYFGFLGDGHEPISRDTAMKLTAVSGCVSLLAGTIGTLSVSVRRVDPNLGSLVVDDHPVQALVSADPHPLFGSEVFFEGLSAIAFLEGNAFAEIQRNRRGGVVAMRPLFDASVSPWERNGRVAYAINRDGVSTGLDQDDVLHLRGSATVRGLLALSPLHCFARTIGIGLSAEKYADKFFKDGVNPTGYISFDGKVTDEKIADEIRDYWSAKFGGVNNAHRPAVLQEGGTFHKLMTDPETAQLFQSRSFQVLDVARAYGVPPHLIGETEKSTSWGSGIQAQTTQFYILSLRKHIKRFEGELNRKLLSEQERKQGLQIKFNLDTLLRADLAARYDAHRIAVGGTQHPGWLTINEVREIEGKPKLDDPAADALFRPVQNAGADAEPMSSATTK